MTVSAVGVRYKLCFDITEYHKNIFFRYFIRIHTSRPQNVGSIQYSKVNGHFVLSIANLQATRALIVR